MPRRVLVVEDSLLSREQIVSILQQEELFESYLTAADGLEGLKLMTEERADFVISDLQMPRLNGLRFLQMMKSLPELSQVPFMRGEDPGAGAGGQAITSTSLSIPPSWSRESEFT